jgi:Raf kinase inhibitor-like YbhB/YbcL family protein
LQIVRAKRDRAVSANISLWKIFATALATGLCTSSYAQQGQLTDVTITGHVYEPQRLPPTDARIESLNVPQGFQVQRFAEGLDNPRMLAVAEDGTVYVTQRTPGNLVMLRDTDGDGIADVQKIVLRQRQLHGIEISGRDIYLADIKNVYAASLRADGGVERRRILSRGLPDGGQHPNRTLRLSPQGQLFVSVGSTCNECREPNPQHATLQRVLRNEERNGALGNRQIFASGLRNTLGFGWHPTSGRLYAFDNGIDWLGDDEQSEELNEIVEGARYGWPFVYDNDQINPHNEPLQLTSKQWAELSEEPVGLYTAHAAPMQMAFYSASQFPNDYRNDAFAAMRGSWNRKPPSGYELVRIHFDAAGDFEAFEPFVTGFIEPLADGNFGYFGRPVGVATAKDGAVLFTDDTNNTLYRVAYGAQSATPAPQRLALEIFDAPATIKVTSPALSAGGAIDKKYSDYGKGISLPLKWSSLPTNTRTLVLLMEDPDAVAPLPFVHWTMIDIPPQLGALPEHVVKVFQPLRGQAARQGTNSKSERGYFGPRPPPGDPAHHYHFQLFALDTQLALPDGYNRHALLKAMQGHVLAKGELVGTFQQPEDIDQ